MPNFLGSLFPNKTSRHVVILIALIVAVYANSLGNGFVWDDFLVIAGNNFVKSWSNFPLIFSRDYLTSPDEVSYLGQCFSGAGEATYRPVVTISYFVDYFLFGRNPFGYHLVNLLFHIFNSVLAYFLARMILKDARGAFFAALFFGLHPIQTEAVNNISFREDLFVFFFGISAFILFIKAKACSLDRKRLMLLFSNLLFFLALFSKEMAVTFPILFLLYDYCFCREEIKGGFWRHIKSYYLAYGVVLLFFLWIWAFVMPSENKPLIYFGQTAWSNFLTMAKVFGIYVFWMFIPVNIHGTVPDFSIAEFSLWSIEVIAAIMALLFLMYCVARFWQRHRVVSFGILWFFIALFPVANIFPIQNIIACRYLYFPSFGFFLIFAYGLRQLTSLKVRYITVGFPRRIEILILVGVMIVYGIVTPLRNSAWRNNDTFYEDIYSYYPQKEWIHRSLAGSFIRKGMIEEAILEFKIAGILDPKNSETSGFLARLYLRQGKINEAIHELRKTIALDESNVFARNALCGLHGAEGDCRKAIACFEDLIVKSPEFLDGHYNLGIAYQHCGEDQKAKKAFEELLRRDPKYPNIWQKLRELEH
ncbi:MAG: tetratricopeptide repeat protein [Candidatus Omnitrophota bacterium]